MSGCMQTAGPSEALIKSGACTNGEPKIVSGGAMWVVPCCQMTDMLDLSSMALTIETPLVYTKDGVPVQVASMATVRLG